MIQIFLKTFAVIFLAELGDKTQLAMMTGASTTDGNGHWAVFAGAAFALVVSSALAVFVGAKLGKLIPPRAIQAAAGCVFVVFGLIYLKGAIFPPAAP
jgi:putative Ca2+/H+ antiporter (TMEM165/GDT1 family)